LQSKQKLKIYLVINTFVDTNKISQAIKTKEEKILRLRIDKKSKKNYFD